MEVYSQTIENMGREQLEQELQSLRHISHQYRNEVRGKIGLVLEKLGDKK